MERNWDVIVCQSRHFAGTGRNRISLLNVLESVSEHARVKNSMQTATKGAIREYGRNGDEN